MEAYPCRVQLEGIVFNGSKPVVSLSDQASRKDQIFSLLLKQSSQSCIPESMPRLQIFSQAGNEKYFIGKYFN